MRIFRDTCSSIEILKGWHGQRKLGNPALDCKLSLITRVASNWALDKKRCRNSQIHFQVLSLTEDEWLIHTYQTFRTQQGSCCRGWLGNIYASQLRIISAPVKIQYVFIHGSHMGWIFGSISIFTMFLAVILRLTRTDGQGKNSLSLKSTVKTDYKWPTKLMNWFSNLR